MTKVVAGTMGNELMGIYAAAMEAKYFRSLFGEMGFPQSVPTIIYSDNEAAKQFSVVGRITQENKHVDIKYMATKQLNDAGIIDVRYCHTSMNLADIGTKAMKDVPQYQLLRSHSVRESG